MWNEGSKLVTHTTGVLTPHAHAHRAWRGIGYSHHRYPSSQKASSMQMHVKCLYVGTCKALHPVAAGAWRWLTENILKCVHDLKITLKRKAKSRQTNKPTATVTLAVHVPRVNNTLGDQIHVHAVLPGLRTYVCKRFTLPIKKVTFRLQLGDILDGLWFERRVLESTIL